MSFGAPTQTPEASRRDRNAHMLASDPCELPARFAHCKYHRGADFFRSVVGATSERPQQEAQRRAGRVCAASPLTLGARSAAPNELVVGLAISTKLPDTSNRRRQQCNSAIAKGDSMQRGWPRTKSSPQRLVKVRLLVWVLVLILVLVRVRVRATSFGWRRRFIGPRTERQMLTEHRSTHQKTTRPT